MDQHAAAPTAPGPWLPHCVFPLVVYKLGVGDEATLLPSPLGLTSGYEGKRVLVTARACESGLAVYDVACAMTGDDVQDDVPETRLRPVVCVQ